MKRSAPGRPRLADDDDTTRINLSLPARQLDEYARQAVRDDVSVPEVIRRQLREAANKRPTK